MELRWRFLVKVVTVSFSGLLLWSALPSMASATSYWAGVDPVSVANYGMQGTISYGNPYTDDDSLEWVMSNNSSGSWVQAGWRKFWDWSAPQQWAEFAGPGVSGGYIDYYSGSSIPTASEVAKVFLSGSGNDWTGTVCESSGCWVWTVPESEIGTKEFPIIQAEGEVHDTGSEIGGYTSTNAVHISSTAYYYDTNLDTGYLA